LNKKKVVAGFMTSLFNSITGAHIVRMSTNSLTQAQRHLSNIVIAVCILAAGLVGAVVNRPIVAHAQSNSSGLVAYYTFNEGSGTSVNDSSGNGNTGTISGATWTTGKYGGALSFNGRFSTVIIPDSASLRLSSGMTLEAWVFPTRTINGWEDVVYKDTDIYFLEGGSTGSQSPPATGGTFVTNGNVPMRGTSALPVNTWTHLAATYDGKTLLLYVNGVVVARQAMADSLTSSTNPLQIGGDPTFGQYFQGTIDEVRVYNLALTQSQIQSDMTGAVQAADTQPPSVPQNLAGTASSSTQVNLSWTASTDNVGVTGYQIWRCQGAGCSNFAQVSAPTGTTYSDASLTASTSYSYEVQAGDAAGNLSGFSNVATVVTAAPQQAQDFTAPTTPTNLVATPVSSSQIKLTWTASTDNVGVTSYQVSRCLGFGCRFFTQIGTATTAAYSDTGLTANTLYTYRVRAVDASGNLSNSSNTVNAKTLAASDTTPPTAPTNLSATPTSTTQINLAWTSSTDNVGVTGYQVWRCQGAGCTGFAQVGTPSGNSYSDTGLAASTAYSYEVRATDAAGNLSAYSSVASAVTQTAVTTPPPPAGTIGFVQVSSATPQGSQTSVSATYSSAQTAGDLNVVVIGWSNTVATVKTLTDVAGNTYALAAGPTQATGAISQSIYYAKNIAAAAAKANTVTVTFNGSASYSDLRILEYQGLDPATPLDAFAAGSGNSSTSSSAAMTTTSANDLILGANTVASMTVGPGSGFVQRILTAPDGDIVEDMVVSAVGSYTVSAPLNGSAAWVMQAVAFRAAGSGQSGQTGQTNPPPPPPPPTLSSIAVTPAGGSISVGSTEQLAALGTYSDGSTQDVTLSATWASTNTSVATIGASNGLAMGIAAGSAQITATVGSIVSVSASLTVTGSTGTSGVVSQLVQHVSCPNSRNTGNAQSSAPDYTCPLPEPSQAGNALMVGVTSSNAGTFTLSDDQSNSWALVDSVVDGNGAFVGIYVATNVAAGTRMITLHRTSVNADNVAMSASEYYNVALSSAVDGHACRAGGNSTTIQAGSITPTVAGDLLWQYSVNSSGGGGNPGSVASFGAGLQANITWQLNGTDLYDGDAVQAGIYSGTSAIAATMSSGTAQGFDTCVMALKGATAGNAPGSGFRIVHMLHQQAPDAGPNPWPVQFPAMGNLVVLSDISGGASISGITSAPANTWVSTGAAAGSEGVTALSQIYYAGNAATGNGMTLAVTRSGALTQDTFMLYDFVGASSAPFDKDSGGETGNQAAIVNTFTTCSGCLTPSGNGGASEVILGNAGWNWCTGTGNTSPSGAEFDAATDTGNSVNGPESVDQNNGWFHSYVTTSSAITVTWKMACGATPESAWAGRVAAFKAAP
jgi:fibronectin type 3 domain-containing protein